MSEPLNQEPHIAQQLAAQQTQPSTASLAPTEATPLLLNTATAAPSPVDRHGTGYKADRARSSSARRKLPWYSRPHPGWLMPYTLLGMAFSAACMPMTLSILNQVSCRAVELDNLAAGQQPAILSPTTPEWEAACRTSNAVSKRLTAYLTTLFILSGITASLTTSSWGTLSDRIGRKPLLIVSSISQSIVPVTCILVYTFPDELGFGALAVAWTLVGLLGSDTMGNSLTTAYLSDSSPEGSKTSVISLNTGLYFAGLSLGPLAGAAMLRLSGWLILPYIVQLAVHASQILALIFVIPESLSPGRMRSERIRRKQARVDAKAARREEATRWHSLGRHSLTLSFVRLARRLLSVIEPMAVLLPKPIDPPHSEEGFSTDDRPALSPKRKWRPGRLDWNLFLIALCYGFQMGVIGCGSVKLLYLQHHFNWGPEQLGLFTTFTSACRLVVLLAVLPLGIKLLKPTPPVPDRPRPTSEASLRADDAQLSLSELTAEQKAWDDEAAQLKLVSDSRFDLSLARGSTLVATISYLILGLPSNNPHTFLLGTACLALASGDLPALSSLALSLASPADAGRVLASIGVISSLVAGVVGPAFFAGVYVRSVDWFPSLVFVVAAGWFACAYVPSLLVSLEDEVCDEEGEVSERVGR